MPACYRPLFHEAVDKFYGAVMAQAESFRKRPDRGTTSPRQPFNGQEYLVLLGFKSLRTSGFFAQVQKLADAIAKLGKLPVSRSRYLSAASFRRNSLDAVNHEQHLILISYHDVTRSCDGERNRAKRRKSRSRNLFNRVLQCAMMATYVCVRCVVSAVPAAAKELQ